MKTKIMMTLTAVCLIIAGLSLIFLPEEIMHFFNAQTNHYSLLMFQFLGAAYLGFGTMNWISRNSLIGGIYNRPLVFGNFFLFFARRFLFCKNYCTLLC